MQSKNLFNCWDLKYSDWWNSSDSCKKCYDTDFNEVKRSFKVIPSFFSSLLRPCSSFNYFLFRLLLQLQQYPVCSARKAMYLSSHNMHTILAEFLIYESLVLVSLTKRYCHVFFTQLLLFPLKSIHMTAWYAQLQTKQHVQTIK